MKPPKYSDVKSNSEDPKQHEIKIKQVLKICDIVNRKDFRIKKLRLRLSVVKSL